MQHFRVEQNQILVIYRSAVDTFAAIYVPAVDLRWRRLIRGDSFVVPVGFSLGAPDPAGLIAIGSSGPLATGPTRLPDGTVGVHIFAANGNGTAETATSLHRWLHGGR